MKKKLLFPLLVFLLTLVSCLKEPQKPSWDVSILTPLFKTSLGIDSFLADSLFSSDSSNQVHLVYNKVLYEYSPNSILQVPDTITSQVYQSPLNLTLQPNQMFINKSEQKSYKFGEAQLSFIRIKSGFINFQVSNSVGEAILMTYSIPLAKKDGVSFQFTELIPAATNAPYVFFKKIDISGYTIDMRGLNGLGANLIGTILNARLNPDGVATQITPQKIFTVDIKFESFVLDYAKGYFSQTTINMDDISKLDIFSIIKAGSFNLETISIGLDIVNGFGLDAQMVIDEMAALNTTTGNSILLNSPILGHSINVMRAVETGNPAAPVLPTVYTINFDNTNILEMFENMPDQITFKINGQTNPMGNISGGNDFYYKGNGLKLVLNLDIPLSIKANALTLIDTVKFNLEKGSGNNTITKGTFHLIADNGFPFDALLQLFMIDSNNTAIDSLLFNNTILAGSLGSNNIVNVVNRTVLDAPLPASKLDKLYNTKKMALKVMFQTNNSHYLKLYDFYRIDLKLTGDFDFFVQQ